MIKAELAVPATLGDNRTVRLNATMYPVEELEQALYARFDLKPVQAEAEDSEELIEQLNGCDALAVVSAALPTRVVESLDRCKLISRLGNGTDKIDVATATEMGIIVSNCPLFCAEEMTDHVMAMLLALARQLPRLSRHLLAGNYPQARAEATQLHRLSTCTLGIVGFGITGEMVARRAQAFGMQVIATRQNLQRPSPAADALGVEIVDLNRLLARSDFVSLQVPLSAATYHLLDAAALRKMKPGAYLINTARGALVDEAALVRLLTEGHLAGAGLDTYECINVFVDRIEPPSGPLFELDNVLLTSHVGAHSVQSTEDVARTGVQNLVTVLSGHWPAPENIVNPGVSPRHPLQPHDPELLPL